MTTSAFWDLASQQSFCVVLLLIIAYVIWKSFRADLAKKDAEYKALEKELRETMKQLQSEYTKHAIVLEQFTHVIAENTAVIKDLQPLLKQLKNVTV